MKSEKCFVMSIAEFEKKVSDHVNSVCIRLNRDYGFGGMKLIQVKMENNKFIVHVNFNEFPGREPFFIAMLYLVENADKTLNEHVGDMFTDLFIQDKDFYFLVSKAFNVSSVRSIYICDGDVIIRYSNPYSDEEVANIISDFVNSNTKYSEISKILATQHPTLQQSTMRLFVEYCNELAKKERFDDRNEEAVKLAKEIAKMDIYMPFM